MESPSKLRPSWIALAIKAGKLVFPLLIKLATVLAKLFKSAATLKLGLAMASFGTYAILLDPRFAILLMVTLALHETGHVLMMRRFGMVTRGFYFIPLIGGAAVVESAFANAWNEAAVALAGPAVGLLTALVPLALYQATGEKVFEVSACWIAFVNLLNLLPVHPLDGGRVMRALGMGLTGRRGAWLFAGVTLLGMGYCSLQGYGIFVLFGALGLGEELGRRYRKSKNASSPTAIWKQANHRGFRRKLSVALGLPPDTSQIDVILLELTRWQDDSLNAETVNEVTEFFARNAQIAKKGADAQARFERVKNDPAKAPEQARLHAQIVIEILTVLSSWEEAAKRVRHHWDASSASNSFTMPQPTDAELLDGDYKNIFGTMQHDTFSAMCLFYDRKAAASFTHDHAENRSDAELAFTPREAAAAILGYGILVFALFDLMELTGGHDAASQAVTFFKGL